MELTIKTLKSLEDSKLWPRTSDSWTRATRVLKLKVILGIVPNTCPICQNEISTILVIHHWWYPYKEALKLRTYRILCRTCNLILGQLYRGNYPQWEDQLERLKRYSLVKISELGWSTFTEDEMEYILGSKVSIPVQIKLPSSTPEGREFIKPTHPELVELARASLNNPNLSERSKLVLKLRFGFEEEAPHTLEEVGYKLNLSRERIRQIEAKTLNNLVNPRIKVVKPKIETKKAPKAPTSTEKRPVGRPRFNRKSESLPLFSLEPTVPTPQITLHPEMGDSLGFNYPAQLIPLLGKAPQRLLNVLERSVYSSDEYKDTPLESLKDEYLLELKGMGMKSLIDFRELVGYPGDKPKPNPDSTLSEQSSVPK